MSDLIEQKAKLLGSLLLFTQVFYKLRTGRDFVVSEPPARESHNITICRELTKILRGQFSNDGIIINVPPRYGKTEHCIHFIAWALAHFPDSNFIYVSYAHSLAKKQTQTIREIVSLPLYRRLFSVEIKQDSSAKDNFETTAGGSVYATGAGGTITGRGAGIQNCNRFGGAIVIDDIHKPAEVTSDTMRESILDWFGNTMRSRRNSTRTPIIFIGQRLHEDDLAAHLINSGDYSTVILKAIDDAGNALNPNMHTREELLKEQELRPYEFSAQYQQDPQPAGGGIFSRDDFPLLEIEPEMLATFITADTAETDKDYNDKTVFSFWGLYQVQEFESATDIYALHWIDCQELQIEPKDLEAEFLQFVASCMRHKVKPQLAAIEKKSTGVTLLSVVKNIRSLRVVDIQRTKASGNKTARFLEMQPFVKRKLISLSKNSKHVETCLEHMRKITANNSHRWDDICDTAYDAVKIGLIDKTILLTANKKDDVVILKQLGNQFSRMQKLRREAYNGYGG